MMNALVLVCLGASIYSIIAVTFFSELDPDNFGDFFTAMFTMFQVLQGRGAGWIGHISKGVTSFGWGTWAGDSPCRSGGVEGAGGWCGSARCGGWGGRALLGSRAYKKGYEEAG
jgi:hypothetical protein